MPTTPDRDLEIDDGLVIPGGELRWRFSRSSGPGGQHVNTTDTRVELSWDVAASEAVDDDLRNRLLARLSPRLKGGVLTVASSQFRSQLRNREAARTRMVALVRGGMRRERTRHATKPTRGSQRRRLEEKRKRGEKKRLRRRPDDR